MTSTGPTSRITALIASALIALAMLTGGISTQTHPQNLADYGSAITADDASDHARAEGVPHMSDNHKGSGSYFERMDGGGN